MPPLNDPILINIDDHMLHPFGANEFKRFSSLSHDIYDVLSQEQTTLFLPHKHLEDVSHAEILLQTALLNQHNGMSQMYFITQKSIQKTIGMIELISPANAKKHYKLSQYPHIIEFGLSAEHTGKGIMSRLLPKLIKSLHNRGITQLGAVVDPKNISAIRVLEKSGINKQAYFDHKSNLYYN